MMTQARSWFRDNQATVFFLVGQSLAIGTVAISIIAYSVRLETRVTTLETRGSPHLGVIDNRLTVLEAAMRDDKRSIERIVDVMTKELHVAPARDSK